MKTSLLLVNISLSVALIGAFWGKNTETFTGKKDFLRAQMLPFRNWKETDHNITKDEDTLLKPDAVLVRSYEGNGEYLEFAVIAGHRKQTVHTPSYCMVGGGWEKVSIKNTRLTFTNTTVPVVSSIMIKDRQELMVVYFFSDGESSTNDLVSFQSAQFLRRIKGQNPLGALIRIAVPITKGRQAAEALVAEYANTHLPTILKQIRDARQS